MTEANFNPTWGGKSAVGDILEVPREVAIQWRRVGVSKPATKAQVDFYLSQRYSAQHALEDEDYIMAEAPEAENDPTGDSFPKVASQGNYDQSVGGQTFAETNASTETGATEFEDAANEEEEDGEEGDEKA